jgi:hypothetical protein
MCEAVFKNLINAEKICELTFIKYFHTMTED